MAQFLDMGGYAAFVWPAYGLAFVTLAGFTVHALARYRAAQRRAALLFGDSSGSDRA